MPSPAASPSLVVDRAVRAGEDGTQTARRAVRADIQALRALAILLVLAHHARLPFVPGGFLGVDVFFVISGFLMGGLIDEGLANGNFTFAGFYARRARRLMPAAYVTLTLTALAAPWLLDSAEFALFVRQLAGSFAFVANIVLWKQADYFSAGADLKPLLHIWSLAVEEQFYLVLPLLLAFSPARWRLPLVAALLLASGATCWWAMAHAPPAAFYLTPARMWELAIGVVVALAIRRGMIRPGRLTLLRALCWIVLLGVPLWTDERGHPGIPALVMCLATAALLIPGARIRAAERPLLGPLIWTGDRSYSLYLLHWPLLAFAGNVWIAPVPIAVNLALVALCVGLSALQYRYVEQRFRRMRLDAARIAALIVIPLAVIGASAGVSRLLESPASLDRAPDVGLSPICNGGMSAEAPACRTADAPRTAVWGDSFGMHVTPGVAATAQGGVIQLTKTFCGPFLDIAAVKAGLYPPAWGRSCIAFNRVAFDRIVATPSIRTVVLSSSLGQYLPLAEADMGLLDRRGDGETVGTGRSPERLAEALRQTVALLRRHGKRVVLVAPPPSTLLDMSRCALRRQERLPTVTPAADCSFAESDYRRDRAAVLGFLAMVERANIVPVARIDTALCAAGRCGVRAGGHLLYADRAHLSAAGSMFVARRLAWGTTLDRLAR